MAEIQPALGEKRELSHQDEEEASQKRQKTTSSFQDANLLPLPCRSIDEHYVHMNRIDEGSYGVVYRAKEKATGIVYAVKKVKLLENREKEGFPITAMREISVLLSLPKHPNVITLKEVLVGSSPDKIYMVIEHCDHELKNLLELQNYIPSSKVLAEQTWVKTPSFTQAQLKNLMVQLLKGVDHMHRHWVIHRDMKTSNLLYQNKGGLLKICDFGLARKIGKPLKKYTGLVVTLWYRAPELLLGSPIYDYAVDMWSVGCIFAELLIQKPIFAGTSELDQLDRIFKALGNPTEERWPGWKNLRFASAVDKIIKKKNTKSKLREKFPIIPLKEDDHNYLTDTGLDLMHKLLAYDPSQRITAKEALEHAWFKEEPLPCSAQEMPTFSSLSKTSMEELKQQRKKSLDEEQMKQREEMYDEQHYEEH